MLDEEFDKVTIWPETDAGPGWARSKLPCSRFPCPQERTDGRAGTANRAEPDAVALRPALFARYGALEQLRYDFPLVLVEGTDERDSDGPVLRPLTSVIDALLSQTAAPGAAGEKLRQLVLGLENAIRQTGGARRARHPRPTCGATARPIWLPRATSPRSGRSPPTSTAPARPCSIDGPVIDCDGATPKAVLAHAWKAVHAAKAKEFRKKVDGLILHLTDILKADFHEVG